MIETFKVLKLNNSAADGLRAALVERPTALAGRETIQIALIREIQDYTILRTEETRELNTVWTPDKAGGSSDIERVAFLATKQKGAESRELESLLRTWNANAGRTVTDCYLKSQLCMVCPRCVLFGATDVSGSSGKGANIKHRIAYATAFSLLPVDPTLRETHTFNGVDGSTNLTGQTLGERESVRPGSVFASIVTLRSATEMEFVFAVKTLRSCTRYGAETRIGGLVRNHVLGIVAAQEEVMSPLELTLELAALQTSATPASVEPILSNYVKQCGTPAKARVFTAAEIGNVIEAVQSVEMTKQNLDIAYNTAKAFRDEQATYLTKNKKKDG